MGRGGDGPDLDSLLCQRSVARPIGDLLTWLALIWPAVTALRGGQVLLFDEIDENLHPELSARLQCDQRYQGDPPCHLCRLRSCVIGSRPLVILGHRFDSDMRLRSRSEAGSE